MEEEEMVGASMADGEGEERRRIYSAEGEGKMHGYFHETFTHMQLESGKEE